MRARTCFFLALLSCTSIAFGNERFVLISGTVNNFHTDARLFNPSFEKDIDVSATFLPVGNADNSSATAVTIRVPKRQMKILDDVVGTIFGKSGLGAIRFSSPDTFEVTSRIYAQTAAGTLGQFGPGLDPSAAKSRGALIQLKAGTAFRTNLGALNPNGTPATVTWTLYDKNSAIINTGTTTMPPLAVISPTNVTSGFFFNAAGADLTDAWVSYASTAPVLVYASVIDNGTTDQTFIPAVDDAGVPPVQPTEKVFDVTLQSFEISISPDPSTIKVGDKVKFRVRNLGGAHSFEVVAPDGSIALPAFFPSPGAAAVEKTITVTQQGTFSYFCTNSSCGFGHNDMSGVFNVGKAGGGNDSGGGY